MAYRRAAGISNNNDVVSIVADTVADLTEVGTAYPMGSICYIIATGAVYMLNSGKEWVAQP